MSEYDEGRIWFRKKGKLVTIGLTEKAFEQIGEVEGVSLPAEGDEVNQDDVIGEISGTGENFELISPVDGAVVSVNDELNSNLDLLVEDPMDEGWICQIRMESLDDSDADDDEGSESES